MGSIGNFVVSGFGALEFLDGGAEETRVWARQRRNRERLLDEGAAPDLEEIQRSPRPGSERQGRLGGS